MATLANWVEALGTWAQVVLVLGSFIFIWWQIRDLRKSLESSVSYSVYQMMVDIDRFFAEKPHLRGYFYRAESQLMGLRKMIEEQVLATAEMITDWFYHAYQQQAIMTAEIRQSYQNFIRALYRNSPALREFITEHQDWYPATFIAAIPGHLESVAETSQDNQSGQPIASAPIPVAAGSSAKASEAKAAAGHIK